MPIWHGRTQSTEGFDAKTDQKTRPDAPLFHHFRTPLRTQSTEGVDAKTEQKTRPDALLFHHFRTPLRTQSTAGFDARTDQKTAPGPQLFTPLRFLFCQILSVLRVGTLKNGALEPPHFAWFSSDPYGTWRWGGGERCASRRPLLIIYVRNVSWGSEVGAEVVEK